MKTRYALVLLALLGCEKNNPTPSRPDVPAARATDAGSAAADLAIPELPNVALLALRGSNLRKVLNLIAPGVPTRLALGQAAPGITPGLGEHGVDIDPDAPFSAILAPSSADTPNGQINVTVAWPLRPGMEVVQNAQAGRGFRDAGDGLFEPTGTAQDVLRGDGGVAAAPCWVARRSAREWSMICGPRDQVRPLSRWLVRAAASAPPNNALLDAVVRPAPARRVLALQLAALEAQDPRRNDAGTNRGLVAQYEAVHRSAENTKQLFEDLSQAHASLVLDDTSYHLRSEIEFAHAGGASTRALVGSSVGQHAALDLLRRLPAAATAYFATGFDVSALSPLLSEDVTDPRMAAAFGPEMVRFQDALRDLTGFRRHGQRAMGFIPGDGVSRVEIVRLPGAAAQIAALRATAAAVPRTPRPSGANPADQFAILPPAPGLPAGSLRLRLGPDPARLPPQVPAEVRDQYRRSVLLVPEGDTLVLVDALDPVARYRAMLTGDRLAPTVPDDRAAVVHLTPAAILSLLGAPPSPEANATDAVHGTLHATRVGDTGARFEVSLDAPVVAVNNVRDQIAALQAQQAQMMRQMQQAQQQAASAQRRAAQPGGRLPAAAQLPEPDFQLQPPR
ncbi:MAG: hypothetical protein IPN17_28900 [Deltaproteobacteria bacterium]|nr:hypothetical protein [Deltaproteobacteria bacterium]